MADIHRETRNCIESKANGSGQEELQVAPVWNPDKAARLCDFSLVNLSCIALVKFVGILSPSLIESIIAEIVVQLFVTVAPRIND